MILTSPDIFSLGLQGDISGEKYSPRTLDSWSGSAINSSALSTNAPSNASILPPCAGDMQVLTLVIHVIADFLTAVTGLTTGTSKAGTTAFENIGFAVKLVSNGWCSNNWSKMIKFYIKIIC